MGGPQGTGIVVKPLWGHSSAKNDRIRYPALKSAEEGTWTGSPGNHDVDTAAMMGTPTDTGADTDTQPIHPLRECDKVACQTGKEK